MKKGIFNTIDDYEVTRTGEIINLKTGRKLKPQPNSKGYLRIQLTTKQKYFIHRLVALKYIPNPENKPQVNHKDGNKTNNCVENLEWVDNLENRQHAVKHNLHLTGENCPWAKLNEKNVIFIRQNKNKYSLREFAEKFNVSISTIYDIITNKSWKNIGN